MIANIKSRKSSSFVFQITDEEIRSDLKDRSDIACEMIVQSLLETLPKRNDIEFEHWALKFYAQCSQGEFFVFPTEGELRDFIKNTCEPASVMGLYSNCTTDLNENNGIEAIPRNLKIHLDLSEACECYVDNLIFGITVQPINLRYFIETFLFISRPSSQCVNPKIKYNEDDTAATLTIKWRGYFDVENLAKMIEIADKAC